MLVLAALASPASPPARTVQAGPPGTLTLTFVANEGVLVSSGETKVLIDALFVKPHPDYRPPAPEVLDTIMKGQPPYDGVDLLLVTHNHPDHFDAALTARYLEAFPETFLLAPSDAADALQKASADWNKIGPRVVPLDIKLGAKTTRTLQGIPVTAFRTLHSSNVDTPMNLMYLFVLNSRRVFHEGDAVVDLDGFRAFGLGSAPVKGRASGSPLARDLNSRASTAEADPQARPGAPAAVDLALVHYWWPLDPNAARFLQEILKPDHIALMHLPIRLESDAPGKIDQVRKEYKDIFLMLPGMPSRAF
jgi:hypothetical protein